MAVSKWNNRLMSRRQFLHTMVLLAGGCAVTPQRSAQSPMVATASPLPTTAPTPTTTPTATAQTTIFNGDRAFEHAVAQMEWVPRHTGTDGWRKCGDYILDQLARQGWSAEEQPFTYMQTDCRNLIGKRGQGPLLIIGAHYDSRRYADEDPDPARRTEPVPAANDGASGIAVLLELARVLQPETLNRTIWLVAFDAEDNGNIDGWDWIAGSTHFVKVLTERPQGMVLVDMIGDADQQLYYERNSHQAMNEGVWEIAADLGHPAFVPTPRHSMLDDHTPFLEEGIPAIDIIDFDYPYWHTTADTLDKIHPYSLEVVGTTVQEWLLQDAPGLPPMPAAPDDPTPTATPAPLRSHLFLPFIGCSYGCKTRAQEAAIARREDGEETLCYQTKIR
jgi:glutaminyl-peptide cyclotransferase